MILMVCILVHIKFEIDPSKLCSTRYPEEQKREVEDAMGARGDDGDSVKWFV